MVVSVSERILEVIAGVLILFLSLYTFLQRQLGLQEKTIRSNFRRLLAYPAVIVLGFYETLFGSGNGILFAFMTFYTRGFDFIKALGYYFVIAFVWVTFASFLFFTKGYFDLSLFVPAILGSVVGGYIGSKFAQSKGNKFIKLMFATVGALLGLKLILGF